MLSWLSELIWADWIWFPEGHGWADLKDHDGKVFPKTQDLWATIPIALCFLVIRQIFERTVAIPLASLLGVSDKQRIRAPPNPVLDLYFCSTSKHPTQSSIESLSKQTGCSVRQVQRWFRRRRNQDRPSKLKKFREASWRFTFYLLAFFAGLGVLINKPWFYDVKQVWENFPKMPLLPSQYWYYMIELGFYISLLFSVASDVKRKDFKEQIVHHVATIALISFSWLVNYIRAGTLIMLVHDAADYLMESAKMFNYAGWRRTCNFIFTVFAAVFIVTRLIILPFWIIHTTFVYPLTLYRPFFGFYFFNGLMFVLQVLHIFWAALILRMVVKFPARQFEVDVDLGFALFFLFLLCFFLLVTVVRCAQTVVDPYGSISTSTYQEEQITSIEGTRLQLTTECPRMNKKRFGCGVVCDGYQETASLRPEIKMASAVDYNGKKTMGGSISQF